MGVGDNIVLTWPGKEAAFSEHNLTAVKKTALIYPWPLPEKTLFTPEIPSRNLRSEPVNRSFLGDNLAVMQQLIAEGYENALDLIYIDPPYMSSTNYYAKTAIESKKQKKTISRLAFSDVWNDDIANYLNHIYPRLQIMQRLLKDNGSIMVHLDWHICHYVKILLDEIFSPQAFINEIIWCYSGGSGKGRHFQRKHDVILWYVKGSDYIFHPQYRPYSEGTKQRGLTRVKGDKYHLHEKGANLQDWWSDINKILSPTARENLKFPTQKPISLLKRIIAATSSPGSLVGDFYAGSGTTAAACDELQRQWICCDSSPLAIDTLACRLIKNKSRSFSVEWDPSFIGQSDAAIKIEAIPIRIFGDQIDVSINIKEFTPQQEEFINESPAAFINFWEVDLDHNGQEFCSDVQIIRNTNKYDDSLSLDIMVRIPAQEKLSIAVRIHDLWGCISTARLEILP